MFGILEDVIDNAIDVIDPTVELKREHVVKLVADGVEIAAIAAAADVSIDVVEALLNECEPLHGPHDGGPV